MIKLHDVGNCQSDKRWHTTDHNGSQSLASHSFNVAMFGVALAEKVLGSDFTDIDELKLVRYALHHDISEMVCGDQPAPYKRALRKRLPEVHAVQEALEAEIHPKGAQFKEDIKGTPLMSLVKLSDLLDALHFIVIKGQATSQNDRIVEKLNQYIVEEISRAKVRYPTYDWDGFDEVKDELFNGASAKELFEDMA